MATKPYAKFTAGQVSATVWENEKKTEKGTPFKVYSTQITKSYKDGNDWKTTDNFQRDDLPKVILVAQKAYEEIALKDKSE